MTAVYWAGAAFMFWVLVFGFFYVIEDSLKWAFMWATGGLLTGAWIVGMGYLLSAASGGT